MTLTRDEKVKLISGYSNHNKDTGSPEVQVAILTHEINALQEHLKTHSKDNSSRRGLLGKVGRRRKILNKLRSDSKDRYSKLINKLGLRK